MAELTISPDEIKGAIEQYVSSFEAEASRDEVGIITDTSDGIAHVRLARPDKLNALTLEMLDDRLLRGRDERDELVDVALVGGPARPALGQVLGDDRQEARLGPGAAAHGTSRR